MGEWARVGPGSDIWSMGATIFVLLTGKCVHEDGAGNGQFLKRAMLDRAPPIRERVAGLPARVARIVDRALAYEIDQRFASAEEMAGAVAEALAISDDAAFVESPTEPAGHGSLLTKSAIAAFAGEGAERPASGVSDPHAVRALPVETKRAPSVESAAPSPPDLHETEKPVTRTARPRLGVVPIAIVGGFLAGLAGIGGAWWLAHRSSDDAISKTGASPSPTSIVSAGPSEVRAEAPTSSSVVVTVSDLPSAEDARRLAERLHAPPVASALPTSSPQVPQIPPRAAAAATVEASHATAAPPVDTSVVSPPPVDLNRRH
jgi:hypothetical protein